MQHHPEVHFAHRIGWLRAAVMGANDGIISTASLIIGVAAAGASTESILVAGVAGLVAGAMSMAAGEYVSVSSQSDVEKADLAREQQELEENPEFELLELTQIYVNRGLDHGLAQQVATRLTEHDALGAHARDELGILKMHRAQPTRAALASAASFALGAVLALLLVIGLPQNLLVPGVASGTLLILAGLGALAARVGGASIRVGVSRVCFWGALAMLATFAIGHAFDRLF